jgi:hypothetical protein
MPRMTGLSSGEDRRGSSETIEVVYRPQADFGFPCILLLHKWVMCAFNWLAHMYTYTCILPCAYLHTSLRWTKMIEVMYIIFLRGF